MGKNMDAGLGVRGFLEGLLCFLGEGFSQQGARMRFGARLWS